MNNPRIFIILVVLIGLAAAGAGIGSHLAQQAQRQPEQPAGLLWPDPRPLPEIALVDHAGDPFDRSRLEGQWSLLFFGFTHCPDICPITLAQLDQMQQQLVTMGADTKDLQTVFVSVDPERDTPARLAEYVHYFNEDFIGVSGAPDELQKLARGVSAVYFIEDEDADGNYLVDHSAAVFVIDPRGRFAGIFTTPHEPNDMAERFAAMRAFIEAQG